MKLGQVKKFLQSIDWTGRALAFQQWHCDSLAYLPCLGPLYVH